MSNIENDTLDIDVCSDSQTKTSSLADLLKFLPSMNRSMAGASLYASDAKSLIAAIAIHNALSPTEDTCLMDRSNTKSVKSILRYANKGTRIEETFASVKALARAQNASVETLSRSASSRTITRLAVESLEESIAQCQDTPQHQMSLFSVLCFSFFLVGGLSGSRAMPLVALSKIESDMTEIFKHYPRALDLFCQEAAQFITALCRNSRYMYLAMLDEMSSVFVSKFQEKLKQCGIDLCNEQAVNLRFAISTLIQSFKGQVSNAPYIRDMRLCVDAHSMKVLVGKKGPICAVLSLLKCDSDLSVIALRGLRMANQAKGLVFPKETSSSCSPLLSLFIGPQSESYINPSAFPQDIQNHKINIDNAIAVAIVGLSREQAKQS